MALSRITTDSIEDGTIAAADIADGSINIDHVSATVTPSEANALKGNNTWGTAAAPEVYGFSVNASGQLIVTSTNEGADNITNATYATFSDTLVTVSGYTWSLSGTDLIATI